MSKYLVLEARGWKKKVIAAVLRGLYCLIPLSTLYKNANKVATWYDNAPSKRIMNLLTPYYMKEIFNADLYGEYTEHKFEGMTVKIVKQYDLFLKQIYGDYMKLPPIEKRNTRHTLVDLSI